MQNAAPRILLGLVAIGYVLWNLFEVYRADAFDQIPGWRFFLWGAMLAVGSVLVFRTIRSARRA
ncbi:MAG: hypothetical protein H6832_12755 [Planctomycetes bacterium]|nr:hypothetical protein [Planctomycetota bacterium]MCB9919264.1 hypothetical protein [Planctomycetota bacterium]